MIRVFFGSPGCGKTTLACRMFYKNSKSKKRSYDYQYSNFDNDLSIKVPSLEGLGSWTFPEHSYIIVDEAGIEYNSRKYKTLDQQTIQWFKLHRHYKCDVDFISQSWEDMDITIRRLADELWYIKKLGPISIVRRVYKSVKVDDKTHQIIDAYEIGKLLKRLLPFPFGSKTWFLVWRPKYYKYFNTYEKPNTPVRTFLSEETTPTSLSAKKEDGPPSAGQCSDPAESNHVGAGSPGALVRRRIESILSEETTPTSLSAKKEDGLPSAGHNSDNVESNHVGAGSPGALVRRRIASIYLRICNFIKIKILSRTK